MQNPGFKFNNTYGKLPRILYTKMQPMHVENPQMILLNDALASEMGLDFSHMSENERGQLFSGNKMPDSCDPLAQAYAGHQFGHFTILGDGRAIVWGEHLTPDGKRLDIQFKGSGRTPYSRQGDGRAALGPMLREYLISEAMHALKIPTTRSLAIASTGEPVFREEPLQGAILTRVASSHIRVGTFEFAAIQKDIELLKTLFDYTLERHYPELMDSDNKAIDLLKVMLDKQSDLVINWMRVGFIHGVMNTDNMTLSGETIDYGPCAFMDSFDPARVFSSIDQYGRYAFANQPLIAQWNLARLAEAILPLIDKNIEQAMEKAEDTLLGYADTVRDKWLAMMCTKLGLEGVFDEDESLIDGLMGWMHKEEADYTNTFLHLSSDDPFEYDEFKKEGFSEWYQKWQGRLQKNKTSFTEVRQKMQQNNPAVIPRNHKVEEALLAANAGEMKPFLKIFEILQDPYSNHPSLAPFQAPPGSSEKFYQTYCGT